MKQATKHFGRFLNERIGVSFYNVLTTHKQFKDNPKVVSCAYYFLKEVSKYNERNNGSSQISSRIIKDLFKNYTSGNYKLFIDALYELGLLIIIDSYCPKENDEYNKGWCKSYKVTDKCIDILRESETDYLKRLMNDKQLKRKIQQSISKRKVFHKNYSDYVLNYIHDGLINTSFDNELAVILMDKLEMNSRARVLTYNNLNDFATKSFPMLKTNDKDGRLWNVYPATKSELRQCSSYKGMKRLFTIDIRACHPTFFSSYILRCLIQTIPATPYCLPERRQVEQEHIKWVTLFTNPDVDPRDIIMKECRYKSLEYTKQALNETLNGNKTYKKVLQWLESEYPNLYSVWQQSIVKETGPNISKHYESLITLNPALYHFIDDIGGVKAMYEYDGFSIFGDTKDTEITNKCKAIVGKMQSLSSQLFKVPIVVKIKETTPIDAVSINEYVREARINSTDYHNMNNQLDTLKAMRKKLASGIYKGKVFNPIRHEQWKMVVAEQSQLEKEIADYLANKNLII